MARTDFAERFQDIYCGSCGRKLLSNDETRVLHDPRYCRDRDPFRSYDTKNGGMWERGGPGETYFYPRQLTQFTRWCPGQCGMEIGHCHCRGEAGAERRRQGEEERRKIANGEFVLLPPKYGPCICDEAGHAILNCMCEKWKAKRHKAQERVYRRIRRQEELERKLKEPIKRLIQWANS